MGLIIKQKEIAKNIKADVYVKIDSVRAGLGENNKITCSCGQWIGIESRASGEAEYKANVAYHIPDENIISNGGTLIDAVYPAFKKFFESQGYEVVDDLNNYEAVLQAKREAEMQAKMAEMMNGETNAE